MNRRRFDCLCAGIVVADHVCDPVDHVPAPGELVLTRRMDLGIGGCAANVAVGLTKLGLRASVVGRVGADVFGRFVRESLERAGVNCDALAESPARDTSGTLVINCRGQDRRFIHSTGANGEFDGSELDDTLLQQGRLLYLGGYCLMESLSPDAAAAMLQRARSAGLSTMLDVVIPAPGDYWPRLERLLPWTDVFLPNEDEGRAITGLDDPLAQASAFHAAGAKTVVVTCGQGGAVLVSEAARLRAGSFDVEFIDGTGSGDAFSAGYIYGLIHGGDEAECLRAGSALGASSVGKIGATTGVFSEAELKAFLASHTLAVERV